MKNELIYPFTGGINMIKKIVAGTIVVVMLGTSNIISHATPINTNHKDGSKKVEQTKQSFEVVSPEKDFVTDKKDIVLSFRAPKDTKVSIEVYHNISKDPKTENYILSYDPIEVTIGSLQMGWAEIQLRSGLNKIQFIAEYKSGGKDRAVRIINVMNMEEVKQLLEEIVSKSTLGIGKRP